MTQATSAAIVPSRLIGWPFRRNFSAGSPHAHRWVGLELLTVMLKPPAFQFYANDWLSSPKIALMSPAEEGAYIRLLAYDWSNDGIPDDEEKLQVLSRLGPGAKGSLTTLKGLFNKHPTKVGFLTHPRLLVERKKQDEWRQKCSFGGKKSGANRSNKKGSGVLKGSSTNEGRVVELKGNSSVFSLQSSDNKNIICKAKPSSIEEVKLQAAKIGLPDSEAEAFFHYYESNGWRVGKNPMKSWHGAIAGWKTRWQSNGRNTKPAAGKEKQLSIWELKTIIDAKETERKQIYNSSYNPDGLGRWDDDFARERHRELRLEIEQLKQKLTAMG